MDSNRGYKTTRAKVTVFVALSQDSGLIGPYFFEDDDVIDDGKAKTIKTGNHIKVIKQKVILALKRKGVYENTIFQQDGAPAYCNKVAIE